MVVGMALLLALAAIILTGRTRISASLQDMLGTEDPAAGALQRVLEHFPGADELLLLVTLNEPAATPQQGVKQLLDFGDRLSQEVSASPLTSQLCAGVSFATDPAAVEFFRREVVPAGLYYLDDVSLDAVAARLKREAMQAQFVRNEALLSTPGPAAGAVAKASLRDPLRLREFLLERVTPFRAALRTWRGGSEMVSEDGRSLLVRIAGARPPSDINFSHQLMESVAGVVGRISRGEVTVEYSGSYAIATTSERAIRTDMIISTVSAVVFMQLLFLVAYRRWSSFLLAFFPVAWGILLAFGVHGATGSPLTPLTAVIGAELAGLAIDCSVHYLSHYEAELRHGLVPEQAAHDTTRTLWKPLASVCLTSMVGFLAMGLTGVKALRDFALLGTLGLGFAFVGTVWLMPAMLLLMARRARALPVPAPGGPGLRARGDLLEQIVASVSARRGVSIGACCAVMAIAVAATMTSGGIGFETGLHTMHPRPNPPLDTQAEIGRRFGAAADSFLIHIEGGSPDEVLERAHAAARALSTPSVQSAGIVGVHGLSSLLPDPAKLAERKARLRQIDAERVLADFKWVVGQSAFSPSAFDEYADFLRALLTSEPPGMAAVARYPSMAATLTTCAGSASPCEGMSVALMGRPQQTPGVRDQAITAIRSALEAVPGATLTGLGVVGYDVEHSVRHALPLVVAVAGAGVFVLVYLAFRSVRDALLALLPVVFGKAVLLGYMSVAGESLNLANMAAMPLLIGIGVDYGIFLVSVSKLSSKRAESPAVFRGRIGSSLHAIIMTVCTTALGFGSLALTSVPAVQSLGRLIAVGVAGSLAGAVFLLIPILAHTSATPSPRGGTG